MYMPYAAMKPEEGIDTALDATRLCTDYAICSMEVQKDTGCRIKSGMTEVGYLFAGLIRPGFQDIRAFGMPSSCRNLFRKKIN